ncbi:MAG: hypothetical protein HYT22_03325 [Candidatus Niyogibacteria bacterium]|nr:hypothetical protein [Candidatus Niyogibacteria bacterium]
MRTFYALLFGVVFSIAAPLASEAAKLTVSPSTGAFAVGGTFSISIFLDTEDRPINTLDVIVRFPSEKLQVISPAIGQSIIGVWTAQPYVNNASGELRFQGGIPGGINVSKGLVSTITFRVRQTGSAIIRFDSESEVLAHDGRATNVLGDAQSGVYSLTLPPQQGPTVISETHPDQIQWYPNASAVLQWSPFALAEYSYILNTEPIDIPDNISEGARNGVVYRDLADGIHYFHIKAFLSGVWGGNSHFAINVDTTPPAEFPVKIIPGKRTTSKSPVIQFVTTDQSSGIGHYEYAAIPLERIPDSASVKKPLFVEAETPVITELEYGTYDIIVRAFDLAGNMREANTRLRVMTPLRFAVTSIWTWIAAAILLLALWYGTVRARAWHFHVAGMRESRRFPDYIRRHLERLKDFESKYRKVLIFAIMTSVLFANAAYAQSVEFSPPFVSTVSRNITNEEIFYIGGKTDGGNVPVIIYLQNLNTGETRSAQASSDRTGDWFYRHSGFLPSGEYLLWTQAKLGDELSPPSPQIQMKVEQTALQFGASRVSYELFYLALAGIFFALLCITGAYFAFHLYHGRKHHKAFWKEVKEAEEAVKRGFSALKRDIERELQLIQRSNAGREVSPEERAREEQLLKDLSWAEQYISKEIRDIEYTEHHH